VARWRFMWYGKISGILISIPTETEKEKMCPKK
jgi:hypothetical protein